MKVFKDKSYNWYLPIKYDNIIKELWASLFIPKNTPYCHHNFKPNKKYGYGVSAKPCKYWCYKYNKEYDCEMEITANLAKNVNAVFMKKVDWRFQSWYER